MVDTVRTQAELLALYADNTVGNISPQDGRDFIVSVYKDGDTFDLRSEFVTAVTAGLSVADGGIIAAAGIFYRAKSGATDIPDILGFIPNGAYTPDHFGAVGDGSTDDQPAFQACVDALTAAGIKAMSLVYHEATYRLASPVVTTTTFGEVVISGPPSKTKIFIDHDGAGFAVASTLTTFKDIDFESDRGTYPNVVGISFAKTSNTDDMDGKVFDCRFKELHYAVSTVGRGLLFQRNSIALCDRAVVFDWPSSGTTGDPLHLPPYGNRKWLIEGNHFHSLGIALENLSSTEVMRGAVIANNLMDIGRGLWKGAIERSAFTGNVVENSNSVPIHITGGGDMVSITGGRLAGMEEPGGGDTAINQPNQGIHIDAGGTVHGLSIVGVNIEWTKNAGVLIENNLEGAVIEPIISNWNTSGTTSQSAVTFLGTLVNCRVNPTIENHDSGTGVVPIAVTGAITDRTYINFQSAAATAAVYTVDPDNGSSARIDGSREWNRGVKHIWGSNSPEGVEAAPVGSVFNRRNGGAGTTFYVKESGTGNTGWVGK